MKIFNHFIHQTNQSPLPSGGAGGRLFPSGGVGGGCVLGGGLLGLLSLLLLSCSSPTPAPTASSEAEEKVHPDLIELTDRQLKTVGITVAPLEERNLGAAIRANGELRLNPQDRAEVVPLVGGIVRRVLVTEGQTVSRGQAVAYIENTELVALQREYLTAVRELELARQDLSRQQLLKRERAGVEKQLQQAEAAQAVAETRVSGLAQQLWQLGVTPGQQHMARQTAVRAPISGTVTAIAAATGSYADPQRPLMTLANNAAVYAQLSVFEKDLPRVAVGQSADIALTYQQDTHIHGTVSTVSRTIDTATRSATVRVTLDAGQTRGRRLGEGMTVTGMVSTDRQKTTALPDGAIISDGGRHYVYALDHKASEHGQTVSHFRRVEVVTGQSELGHTAVSFPQPQKAGTQYVHRGAFYIASAQADHGEHTH